MNSEARYFKIKRLVERMSDLAGDIDEYSMEYKSVILDDMCYRIEVLLNDMRNEYETIRDRYDEEK